MSIFKNILSKIFHPTAGSEESPPPNAPGQTSQASQVATDQSPSINTGQGPDSGAAPSSSPMGGSGSVAPNGQSAPGSQVAPDTAGMQGSPAGAQAGSADRSAPGTATQAGATATSLGTGSTASGSTSGATTASQVDVEAVLNRMQAQHPEKLNWRTSIVDLMKLLGLDSSLSARKQLAAELNYTGSTDDSAAMNIWLHQQVMRKLAENGGRVPDDLKH